MTETAGTPVQAPPGGRTALFAGRYRAERLLGRGGMGEVYAVLDESSGRALALKRLSPNSSERQAAAFEREYRTLASLAHPHIVEVCEYVVTAEGPFYTMELLSGGDLSTLGQVPWREVCRVVRDVASTLGLLHARRILHRDLSPKNIWRLPDGRIKLIDFGALTAFGAPSDVVGTPPFIPPEALGKRAQLDQRSDLYALGALSYWLLTGHHAFSARSLAELPSAWKQPVIAPSQRIGEAQRGAALPAVLDALIESLLQADPTLRPVSTAALIDQLNALAELPPEEDDRAALDLLRSPALVARGQDQIRLGGALRKADRGQGDCVIVEGAHGLGRTRLLEELSVSAQLLGIGTLRVDASAGERPFGLAQALSLRLLDTLPVVARAAAAPLADELALLGPALAQRLAVQPAALVGAAPGERRMRITSALLGWFTRVAESRTLALFVDDLALVDEESQSFLLALAHQVAQRKLLIVASLSRSEPRGARVVAALRKLSRRLVLKPFRAEDSEQLLVSLFGSAPYVARLAERLQQETDGNPAHILLLLEDLVQSGSITYAEGVWSLPRTLDDAVLSRDRSGARKARLAHLSVDERAAAQVLSVHAGSLSRAQCLQLIDADPVRAEQQLNALLRTRVLVESELGFCFSHEELRLALQAELNAEQIAAHHRTLGELLLADQPESQLDQLRAGLHLLRGGEQQRSAALIMHATLHFGATDPTYLGAAVPLFEEALALLTARGAPREHRMALHAALSVAGYYVDRRLAVRHGDAALQALSRALYLHWARAMGRFIGKKPALLVALFCALCVSVVHRKQALRPSLKDTLLLLFYCASTLAGVGAVCIDAEASGKAARAIEPLAALGKEHIAGFVYRYCCALRLQSQGHLSASAREWQSILARLDRADLPRGMPAEMVVHYRAGALLAYGVKATWRDGPEALQVADQLSRIGMKLYEMSAEQLRAGYYANQGQLLQFEQHKKLLDQHAIQRGTTWQVETWAPNTLLTSAQRIDDVLLMKQAMADGERSSREVDTLLPYVIRARATYCVMTRRYLEALTQLERDVQGSSAPQSYASWARMRGTLARALNGLGEHARALSVCRHALEHMHDEDRNFPAMNLIVETELAQAELGLGRHHEAARTLDALLARHAPNKSPLTLFTLHEARAQVAHAAGDAERARVQLTLARSYAEQLGLPPLLARAARLDKVLGGTVSGVIPYGTTLSLDGDAFVATCLQKLLSHQSDGVSLSQHADNTLSVAMELSGADRGLVLGTSSDGPPALLAGSEHASPDLLNWVEERLLLETKADGGTASADDEIGEPDVQLLDGAHYRVLPLWAVKNQRDVVVGALAIGLSDQLPEALPLEALRVMGARLGEAMSVERSEHVSTVS